MPFGDPKGNYAGTGAYGTGDNNTFNNSPAGGYGGDLGWGASGQSMSQGLFGGMSKSGSGSSTSGSVASQPSKTKTKTKTKTPTPAVPTPTPTPTPTPSTPNFSEYDGPVPGDVTHFDPYNDAYSNVYSSMPSFSAPGISMANAQRGKIGSRLGKDQSRVNDPAVGSANAEGKGSFGGMRGFARGGVARPGETVMVGELGPELMRAGPGGAQVQPMGPEQAIQAVLRALMSGGC